MAQGGFSCRQRTSSALVLQTRSDSQPRNAR